MKKYIIVSLIAFGSLLSSSNITHANTSTVINLSPTHTLITYSFTETFMNRDIVVPVLAHTNASHSPLTASYQLLGINPDNISSQTAVILSNASINHGGYTVQEGTKQTYTLLVLVEHTANIRPNGALVVSLPIFLTEQGVVTGQTVKTY